MVTSHLGRPKEGVWSEADSLAPVAARLSRTARHATCRWCATGSTASTSQPGQLVLLENCRMNVGEGKDDEALAKKYAALCDVFVMDAFGTAHRAQASTHGVIRFAKVACRRPAADGRTRRAGARRSTTPARPLLAIVAGTKVSTKLELLSSLVGKVDQLIVGGGIANTFIAAMGHGVGKSLVETDLSTPRSRSWPTPRRAAPTSRCRPTSWSRRRSPPTRRRRSRRSTRSAPTT